MTTYEELTKTELIFIIKSLVETKTTLNDSVAISQNNKVRLNILKDKNKLNNYNDTITYLLDYYKEVKQWIEEN